MSAHEWSKQKRVGLRAEHTFVVVGGKQFVLLVFFLLKNTHRCTDINRHRYKQIYTLTHTHTRVTAIFRDYPGEPVPER